VCVCERERGVYVCMYVCVRDKEVCVYDIAMISIDD